MPVIPVTPQKHREKDPDLYRTVPAVSSTCAPLEPYDPITAILRMPLAVHTLLSWRETRTNPEAVQSIKDEMAGLQSVGTWDAENVMERDDLIAWAQANKEKIIVGEGLGISSIKNSELPPSDPRRKYKGRFCYRTPTARDESGAIAVFQEMSSRPTTIVDMNLAIAYGLIVGHCITISDAIKAYVQSYLKEKPLTYFEIPKYLCPPEWAHLRRPVCRLIKAHYDIPKPEDYGNGT